MYRVPYPLFLSLSEAGSLLSSKWAGCGMKLRGDDPGTMKDFVLSIQNSVNQLKLHSGVREDGKTDICSRRVSLCCSMHLFKKHHFPRRFLICLNGFHLLLRWNLCLRPYVTLRTIRKGLKRILHTIPE